MTRRRVRNRDRLQATWDGLILRERILDDQLKTKKITADEFERQRDSLWKERNTLLPKMVRLEGARNRLRSMRERR